MRPLRMPSQLAGEGGAGRQRCDDDAPYALVQPTEKRGTVHRAACGMQKARAVVRRLYARLERIQRVHEQVDGERRGRAGLAGSTVRLSAVRPSVH
jgi:hypothetical protein